MNTAKIKMILSMVTFGTIGLFVHYIPLSSSIIAAARGLLGVIFIFLFMHISGRKVSYSDIRKNIIPLVMSGCFIGINWILLFESYNYIGVANATLCYYLEPVILILGALIIYKERISPLKGVCIMIALFGMVFVSGVFPKTEEAVLNFKGIALGLGAALFYASVILINRKLKTISPYDMTMVQLFCAFLITLPYVIVTEDFTSVHIDMLAAVLLIIVGVVHTGMAYVWYFSAVRDLSAQSTAVLSYIDPMVAIILSMTPLLGEKLTLWGILGAAMILGSAFVSEVKK